MEPDRNSVVHLIILPSPPATNNDTITGTGTIGNIILTGYPKSFLVFKDDAKEEVLSSLRFRDDIQDGAYTFLLP